MPTKEQSRTNCENAIQQIEASAFSNPVILKTSVCENIKALSENGPFFSKRAGSLGDSIFSQTLGSGTYKRRFGHVTVSFGTRSFEIRV